MLTYIEALESAAEGWGVCYLDIHTPMAELTGKLQQEDAGNSLTRDSIHPNAAGQRFLAYSILQAQGADSGPLSAILLPEDGEAQALRGEVDGFYRGTKGMRWNWKPETLPLAVTKDMTEFRDFFDGRSMLYGSVLQVGGLSEEVSYTVRMAEQELGSFTGKELADGIDLNMLAGHPQRTLAEQAAALNRKRHQEAAAYRKMWIDVMLQRASYTREQAQAAYDEWRAADGQLRGEIRTLAEEMSGAAYPMYVLQEGYTAEELEQEAVEAEEARKAAEEQARLEAEEAAQKAAAEQARIEAEQARLRAEEQARTEAEEREALELARLEEEKAQKVGLMRKRLLVSGACLGSALAVMIVIRKQKGRKG